MYRSYKDQASILALYIKSYLEGSSEKEGTTDPPTDSPRDFEWRFFRLDTASEPPEYMYM